MGAPDRGAGPPEMEEAEAGAPPGAEPRHRQLSGPHHKTDSRLDFIRAGRRDGGRYAHAWRDGFRVGAVDALRLMGREVDNPDVWLVLARLAEYYDRDRDEYDVCGGGR